ncbi:MAG TPA: tRNA (adenosine(37)-N6)-dimethylallyltransferase MiaA [Cyclobacteriaceae bacterium]|nr:tRNA (adenosine(37)-N6)-dimethylallyltransferase MiaA [Cyclobacteriaceae bacterium]
MTLIVVAGPTAVGKTRVAITLAERLGTEIVSADARQVFREMRIGTAQPSEEERARVKHHLVGTRSIHEPYSAAAYGAEALAVIHDLFTRYNTAVMCGGSGLYIKAVLEGFDEIPDVDPAIRQNLNREYREKGLPWLQEKMRLLDPEYYAVMEQQNPQRLIRALEVRLGTGRSMASFRTQRQSAPPFSVIKIGLTMERAMLYQAIDQRVDRMVEEGLFEEATALYPHRHLNALRTVGYQEVFDYIEGRHDREEAIRLIKQHSRQYAKRQLTWFRRDPEYRWFEPGDTEAILDYIALASRDLSS